MNISSIENIPITVLGLSARHYNSLMRAGCSTLGRLQRTITSNSLWDISNIGEKSVAEIEARMEGYLTECGILGNALVDTREDNHQTKVNQAQPFEVIADLPLKLFTFYLPNDQIKCLSEAGIQTIGQLNKLLEKFKTFISSNEQL